jgi:hypothetical protein
MNINNDNRQLTTSQNFQFSSYSPEDSFGLLEFHVTHAWPQNNSELAPKHRTFATFSPLSVRFLPPLIFYLMLKFNNQILMDAYDRLKSIKGQSTN